MSASFRVEIGGQTVPIRFQTVSFAGIRAIVSADITQDINARAAKAANLSDLASAAAARTNIGADLAANVKYSFSGAATRPVETRLRETISVKDPPFNAAGDGVTNDATAIAAAFTAAGLLTTGAVVYFPPGRYLTGATTITVPAYTVMNLDGAYIVSSAANGVNVAVGNAGATGRIRGSGHNCGVEHTGTGAGVIATGIVSQADLYIEDIWIKGSASGAAGLQLEKLNRCTTRGLKVTDYSAGSAIRSVGANAVTHFTPELTSNLHGIHNLTTTSGGTFTSNAIRVFGGQIKSNTGWGWFEDTSGAGGRNLNNGTVGVVFEANGVNVSATTGDIFNNNCDQFVVDGSYFENGIGLVPTNCITIGSGTEAPKGTRIVGNFFTNTNTNTVNDVNGQSVFISDNVQNGANTNFVQHGAAARGLFLGPNRVASINYFAGSDGGLDSVIVGGLGGFLNQSGPTIRGFGYNYLSGLNQDLVIRTRGGGTNATAWQAIDGTGIGQMSNAGGLNVADAFYVGSVKVVGARNTGWTAATGPGSKGAFAAAAAGTASASYVQSELQGALNRIAALEARVKSYDDALFTHGLIGA